MSINEGALKKFAETFGPAIEAIPHVLGAASQVSDMERLVKEKAKELKSLEEASAEIVAAKEKSIALAEARLAEVQDKTREVFDELGAVEGRMMSANAELVGLQDRIASETEKAVAARQSQIDKLSTVYQAKVVSLEEDFAKIRESLEAEIKQLESKRSTAQKALDRLKAKLG